MYFCCLIKAKIPVKIQRLQKKKKKIKKASLLQHKISAKNKK